LTNRREIQVKPDAHRAYPDGPGILKEDAMLEHRREIRFSAPIAPVFSALLGALAAGRWDGAIDARDALYVPRRGCRYSVQRKGRLCRGQVLECLRPVSLIVQETLYRGPSRVAIRSKWRLEPIDGGALLKCEIRALLNRAANLHRRNWEQKLARDCARQLAAVRQRLETANQRQRAAAGVTGQNTGNKSIVSTKISAVNGKPIFR
jgi:hypothetical protein